MYIYIEGRITKWRVNSFFRNLLLDNYLIKDYGRHRRRVLFLPRGGGGGGGGEDTTPGINF